MRSLLRMTGVASIFLLAGAAAATTYLVNPDGTGDYPTIQAAINAAVDGDVIELADGTFRGDGNRDIDYLGKAITVRSQSGNPEACVLDCEGSESAYHRGFLFYHGEGASSVLQGLMITNGYHYDGGAVQCSTGSPSILACVLAGNESEGHGGALLCQGGGSPSVESCVFRENMAALYGGGTDCFESSPRFVSCLFEGNECMYGGGGIDFYACPGAIVTGCHFSSNSSWWPGGGVSISQSSVSFTDCVFSGNFGTPSGGMGGGADCSNEPGASFVRCEFIENVGSSGGGVSEAAGSFESCTFIRNEAAHGGGVTCYASSRPVFTDCEFLGNHSRTDGGGVYGAGDGDPSFVGCRFLENTAVRDGGGVYWGKGSLSGCTFARNEAETGGGMLCNGTATVLPGSTFYANRALSGSGIYCAGEATCTVRNAIISFGVDGEGVRCEQGGTIALECCDVFGNASGDWVGCIEGQLGIEGNISLDPLYCRAPEDDFTLHADSPCAPEHNPECGLIGAWPVGCEETPVERTTWGGIKALFR